MRKPIPIERLSDSDIQRFWALVDVRSPDECWNWKGATKEYYPFFRMLKRKWRANRVSLAIKLGGLHGDLHALHKCDNRRCCNPNHLFLGTVLDNSRDKYAKQRSNNPQGERHGCARLTAQEVLMIYHRKEMNGLTHREIGKLFGVSKTAVGDILRGNNWRSITNHARTE